jgi:hypothetical protein
MALSQRLAAPLAALVATYLATADRAGRCRTAGGEGYTRVAPGLTVEVLAGTTRHPVVTVTRLR